ncbi:hypothetical protein [Pseudochelatococcus contaminans]|uniref:Conjugal transfer/entry exclusion protein n=1 Tax=Pseudochelatococcus contaminans TaxID=1538103 RepID=A0A7W5Z4M8_9HYPH|nr:hypothetical protein [Pseudochelatococcus contaminans]MBB3810070.1 conjugal transfer/entry exclusion protein [Pseudochelatococcus contaminans]
MGALSIIWQIVSSRIGIAAIAGTLSYGVGYHRGHSHADQTAQVAVLQSQVETARTDLKAAQSAERIARAQAEQLAEITLKQTETVNDLEKELASRPGRDACRVTDADARRLLNIQDGE